MAFSAVAAASTEVPDDAPVSARPSAWARLRRNHLAVFGLVLVALYVMFVSDRKLARHQHPGNLAATPVATTTKRAPLRTLVSTPAVIFPISSVES